ncbi:MAG: hypothetical protein M1587_02425 [Thaumarchaeota archaeon]|nr:hypothetical protein [Nitrososphaerota archaeon]
MLIPQEKRRFWESLGVSIDDIEDLHKRLGSKITNRLANKLKSLSPDWTDLVSQYYKVKGDSIKEISGTLYSKSKSDFGELLALATFANNRISETVIVEQARKKLKGNLRKRLNEDMLNPTACLLPLLKTDSKILGEIYYEHVIQKVNMKRYHSSIDLRGKMSFDGIGEGRLDSMLQDYENSKRPSLRRPIKLWWLDKNDDRVRIIFRREKRDRSQLKLVERNEFWKTGDEKIIIFSGNCTTLELYSRREPKRTVEIAQYLISRISGLEPKFLEELQTYTLDQIDRFISNLKSGEFSGATLVSLKSRNLNLPNSPSLEIQCSENDVLPAIRTLAERNTPLLKNAADVVNFRVLLNGRIYSIRTKIEGKQVHLIFDNRNLPESEKTQLSDFLKKTFET